MWFYVVCLLLSLLSKASSLNCHSGAEIFSELFDLQLGNTTECFDEVANRCFRMDGELLFFGLVDGRNRNLYLCFFNSTYRLVVVAVRTGFAFIFCFGFF